MRITSRWKICVAVCALLEATALRGTTAALDEDTPWPRVKTVNGNKVTVHLPQVESWTSNWFKARAAVEVKPADAKKELLGVIWLEARGNVDHTNRVVTLDAIEVTKGRFPDASDNGSNALAIVRSVVPQGVRTVSLDYLVTALGFERAAARRGARGLKHEPPDIVWATNRSVLVLIDSQPVLRPVSNTSLERVINTPALLVFEKQEAKFYLNGADHWFAAPSIKGPWSLAQNPPPDVANLAPPPTNRPAGAAEEIIPRVIVSTSPSELLMTSGLPDFRPIKGTSLQYAADTDSQVFFHTVEREAYVLISGRWFKATSLQGPWSYVAPADLPSDFAKIPPGSAQGIVLASVPGTAQAELALLASSVPTTAVVNRKEAKLDLSYDGEPKFKPIEGTSMSYALNAKIPVIQTGSEHYALEDGVWFVGKAAQGPWEVATEVPEAIYTIPPSSPVYYATFANVYEATNDEVEVGYTPGYQGTYEDQGTVVYGTGYEYEPWYGEEEYYGWGWSWGYGYGYVPWYLNWVWRPWWNEGNGLRAAVIENIYDRWDGRNGVSHYDRDSALARARPAGTPRLRNSGFPATYGRFTGANRPAALTPPANTLSLNPYTRPKSSARAGDPPHGAQLLSTVRQAPGGGRDLYASPDGHVYRHAQDGWYQQQGGRWNKVAPAQSAVQGDKLVAARDARNGAQGGRAGGARGADSRGPGGRDPVGGRGGGNRVPDRDGPGGRGEGIGNRVPDSGFEPGAVDVSALEREYAARALAQSRAQNWRNSGGGGARGGRGGGRRR
jgi:hypothetical protein